MGFHLGRPAAALSAALALASTLAFQGRAQAPAPEDGVRLSVNPERVCLDPRPTSHLNFDLIVSNGTDRELKLRELRAMVLDRDDQMVERRIAWQDALSIVGPARTVAPHARGLLFNPFAFNAVKAGRSIRYEIDFEGETEGASVVIRPVDCTPRTRLLSPLAGRIIVYDGHDFLSHHRRQSEYLRPELQEFGLVDNWFRFGLDLLPVDARGAFFRGDGRRREDWFGWEAPLRSPADGIVTATADGQPDNDQIGTENLWVPKRLSQDEMNPDGNYVLIDHGGGEFSLLSHVRQGSVRVRKGDRVRAGQVVAQVGSSGSSLFPHVHYELRAAPGWGVRGVRSLPPYFRDVRVVGTGEGADGGPVQVNTGDVFVAR
jgi:hypothetical protein